ncbi:MAG: YihA family ribosome biogenesis GTP-binding protein [Ignavibacteria bacterium]|nr:YihA family ribosome biogenesis GTP-binding protein [Ignavibacteria bacterium]
MNKIEFYKAIYNLTELPKRQLSTIVLCGRSNVGKSSFINCLFSPQKVAKTSSTPGKTRSINYYLVDDKIYLVDLPGFGYAKVSKTEREYWQKIIEKYFVMNDSIILAFHIVDSRHEPTELDDMLHQFLVNHNISFAVILNKIDKLKQSEIAQLKRKSIDYYPNLEFEKNLFHFSSTKGIGKKEIFSLLESQLL